MPFKSDEIIGIQVFLERRKTRQFVGLLKKIEREFHFEYASSYLKSRRKISLGPEMPLTRRVFKSNTLFVPFSDRIPSRENPAYVEYCRETGIKETEIDPLVLLATIAHRGPSSFIFEPLYEDGFTSKDLAEFRKSLGLSVKEFAACFDFSPAAVTRTELQQSSGREILKRAAIYANYPHVTRDLIRNRGGILHPDKQRKVEMWLSQMLAKVTG